MQSINRKALVMVSSDGRADDAMHYPKIFERAANQALKP
jgi:hypothetical protein